MLRFNCLVKALAAFGQLMLSVGVLLFAGCERSPSDTRLHELNPLSQQAINISVVDDFGRTVTLTKPAQRIVALSPHIVENLYSADLGERIVAAVDFADYPEAAKRIARVGGYANFSVESILAFKPDLVVGWGSGYAGFSNLVEQLEQLGVAVFVDEPQRIEDITHSIARLAILGATQAQTQARLDQFSSRLAALAEAYRVGDADAHQRVGVFYQIWPDPIQTLNSDHIVDSVIELCGGKNIFADAAVLAPVVNIESVLARDPEVIIASASNNQRPPWLDNWQAWQDITAVTHQQLYFVPGDLLSRHTLRMLDGALHLCEYIERARTVRNAASSNDNS